MRLRRGVWLAPLLLGVAAVSAQTTQAPMQRGFKVEQKPEELLTTATGLKERYALIIGISQYANPSLNLNAAAADAQALARLLGDPEIAAYKPENVRLLVDDQATRKNIISALGTWLKNRVTADDSVVIFYSGHGALGNGNEAYWVTYDADTEDLAASAISNKEISSAIAALPAKRKITLIDSCYSEATAKKYRAVVPANVFDELKGTGVVTITASTGAQKSVEVEGHGAFTYHLLEAMQGKADKNANGVVELDEIWTYLNERVQKTAADAGNRQTPVLMAERLEHGFPVTVNPAASAAPVIAALKTMYGNGEITLVEMAEAERLFSDRAGNPEIRNLYKGLAEKAISPEYFHKLLDTLKAAPAGAAGRPTDATRGDATPAGAAGSPTLPAGAASASAPELEAFRAAEALGTFEAWLRFAQQFPRGALAGAVQSRVDELEKKRAEQVAFDLARKADQEQTWQQFMAAYPGSPRLAEAERRSAELRRKRESELGAFKLADSKATEAEWTRFLEEYRGGALVPLGEERLATVRRLAREKEDNAFALAVRRSTLEDWDRFLDEFGRGPLAEEAAKRRADLARKLDEDKAIKAENDLYMAARTADTIEAWNAYSAKYTTGPRSDEARKRLEQLRWYAFADVAPVPGGAYQMGSESDDDSKPVHRVEVAAFLMGRSEVTNAQYLKFIDETGRRRPPDPGFVRNYLNTHPDLPVLAVGYDDALAFCRWLGEKTGATVRLPTEAEWEYAATGGGKARPYPWGAGRANTNARFRGNAPDGPKTVAATAFAPGGFGLVNMAGNVAEWVMDYYADDYYKGSPASNPQGPPAGKTRVVRGGSWKSGENELMASARAKQNPAEVSDQIGFRILIEPPRK
jgi:sulfatase modifying factor 1